MAIDEKTRMKNLCFVNSSRLPAWGVAVSIVFSLAAHADAQTAGPSPARQPAPAAAAPARTGGAAPAATVGVVTPPGYVIGVDDSLDIVYWREKELSANVVVRPDGMISLPLLNDIRADGLTPEQLRAALTTAAAKFVEEPTVTVVVKEIRSRKVFITGQVGKPGPYLLNAPMTVLQLIAVAGGVAEFADKEHIVILRTEDGKPVAKQFNYKEVLEGKKLQQNIELKPGDSVAVP